MDRRPGAAGTRTAARRAGPAAGSRVDAGDGTQPEHAVCLHEGGCWNAGERSRGIDWASALQALTEGVPASPHCRPDAGLGILD
ncbi:DUF6233 domain-containing protein [Streptomyces sp. NPDC005917]|uniref:DUF6233 domain-containing protein n=1 Tax=unclassified Streptomyces TaxID=2593676 RepID=UPI0033FC6855